jgi:hypothetical protein
MKACVAIDMASCYVYGLGADATRVEFVADDARPFRRVNGAAVMARMPPPYEIRGSSVSAWVRPKAEMRAHIESALASAEAYTYLNGSNELCRALLDQVAVANGRSLGALGVRFAPTTEANRGLAVANLVTFDADGPRLVRAPARRAVREWPTVLVD